MTELPTDQLNDPPTDATRAFDALPLAARRAAWLDALTSGDYQQGHGALRVGDPGADATDARFCCLGVAEDVRRGRGAWRVANLANDLDDAPYSTHVLPDGHDEDGDLDGLESLVLTDATRVALGLRHRNPWVVVRSRGPAVRCEFVQLSELNDDRRFTLAEVAAVLRDQGDDWTGDENEAFAEVRRRNAVEGRVDGDGDGDGDDDDDDDDDAYHEYDHDEETDDD